MKIVVAALAGGAAADKLWTDGLHIAGVRYVVFKVEGRSIYGRQVYHISGSRQLQFETLLIWNRGNPVSSSARPLRPF